MSNSKKIFDLIPKNKRFDMSDLINEINKKKMKIGVSKIWNLRLHHMKIIALLQNFRNE